MDLVFPSPNSNGRQQPSYDRACEKSRFSIESELSPDCIYRRQSNSRCTLHYTNIIVSLFRTITAKLIMAAPSTTNLELPSAQALQSSEQMKLLDAVDALRAHGLGEITALPQLVVCGDQSSGKSSVLQAISGVPFPRKANVCTRFATEVILRRARVVRISVSIVPSKDLPAQDRERILGFQQDLASIEDFADLFKKAKETMGISDQKKTFSKDVLRVEFWGPTQPQLTLVDLPGLIHSETEGQTKDDIKLVDDLVTSYLKSPRSIILAIVSAKYDINNQVILRRAREVDPEGKRTLGIITKPDAIDNDDDERAFIKIARNENVKFVLGWHVVKNMHSGSENAQQETRDMEETNFFNTNISFSTLPKKDVGIDSLRTRLSSVLFDQIKVELPRLVEDIESRVRATKAARDRLGPGRPTIDEQRGFLIELSESFQNICRDAVAGHYDHEFFQGDVDGERRLCANLLNKHFEFAKSLRKKGASWKITREEDQDDDSSSEITDDSEQEIDDERKRSREEAIEEACKVLKRSRGREVWQSPFLIHFSPLLSVWLVTEYSPAAESYRHFD
jgi:GTPase SAR1 family protein